MSGLDCQFISCSNKKRGCDWQGELGQLDQHLNVNPDKDKQLFGCDYSNVKCLFCDELYPRSQLKDHQKFECLKRPYSCPMCDNFKSTYEDVSIIHASECKCRPVECPNSCGASNLQHQHLEEHVSSQCPLTLVECEFSDAGCDVKVYRRDLPSHLVTHMSLFARESRKQNEEHKQQVKELKQKLESQQKQLDTQKEQREAQQEQIESLKQQLEAQKQQWEPQKELLEVQSSCQKKLYKRVMVLTKDMEMCKNNELMKISLNIFPHTESCPVVKCFISHWASDPFYSKFGGYKLQLVVSLVAIDEDRYKLQLRYKFLVSEFQVQGPPKLNIVSKLESQNKEKESIFVKHNISHSNSSISINFVSINELFDYLTIQRKFLILTYSDCSQS